MGAALTPVEVFCSYAHEDEAWRQKVESHLSLLRRQGLISLWHDRLIAPGTDWATAIDTHLETASVILLLVSADFLASDYCYGVEMKRALERQEAGGARVVPILVRPVDWTGAPFAHLQSLPTNAKPLASWRNKETVLADVAAGIRRVIVEELPQLSASAPRAALPAIWNVPYPRNPFFLGRETELALVRHHLQAGQAAALSQPQAISGLGGVGKTHLAVEYAYQHRADYQAVLWARAESTEALTSSYLALAKELNLPQKTEQDASLVIAAVQRWLRTNTGWLLILDNADDLAVVRAFLPPNYTGHVLLTTRAQAMGRLAHRLDVDILPPELGALFLLRRAGCLAPTAPLEQASLPDQEAAYAITRELGGLPLALDQAGAYIEETGCRLADYRQFYQQHRADLLPERRGQVADHPEAVATTWSLAFERIEQAQPAAADLLRLCAFLAPDAIPEEVFIQGAKHYGPPLYPVAADPFRLNQALAALRAYSLVRRDATSKTLTVHRLVQAVLQDTMAPEERRQWAERTVQAVNAAFPNVEFDTLVTCQRLLPHAQACLSLIGQGALNLPEAAQLLVKTGRYLTESGQYQEAETSLHQAVLLQERYPGSYAYAQSLSALAFLYNRKGRYAQAEPLYQRVLAIYEEQLGPRDLATANGLNNLALFYETQGRYAQAEPLYQRVLAIYEEHEGLQHPATVRTLGNLVRLYRKQRKYAQAETLGRQALAVCEEQLGPRHIDTAASLNNLAWLYKSQGRYAQAEPLYQRALAIYEEQLGPRHIDTAASLNCLAMLYAEQGKYSQAEPLYQRALAIEEEQLGPTHPTMATYLNELALFYEEQGKHAKAEPLYQRALTIYEERLGPAHSDTRIVRRNYVRCLRMLGRDAEADQVEARDVK